MAEASQSPVASWSSAMPAGPDEPGELGRLALALEEQHAVELERGGRVEVLGSLEGAERLTMRRFGRRPPVGEGLEGRRGAGWRTACSRGAEA